MVLFMTQMLQNEACFNADADAAQGTHRLGGLHSSCGRYVERENLLPPQGIEPTCLDHPVSSPVAIPTGFINVSKIIPAMSLYLYIILLQSKHISDGNILNKAYQ
jgi:hypothetical protein